MIGLAACSGPDVFQGTELTSRSPAAPFELRNQFDQVVRLSDYEDRVVLVTFLYTSCPDVCPITTSQIRDARELLADDAADVAFVAISVDPERDSIHEARAYSDRWEMTDSWDFLVGSRQELSRIWEDYYVDPALDASARDELNRHAQVDRRTGVDGLRQDIADGYLVIHSAPLFLIDQEGISRVVFTQPFETEALVHDIRLLLE